MSDIRTMADMNPQDVFRQISGLTPGPGKQAALASFMAGQAKGNIDPMPGYSGRQVQQAGFGAVVPAIGRALGPNIGKILGALGIGAGIVDVMSPGMGFIQSGPQQVGGVPLGGPGLAEPPAEMVAKEWSTGTAQFYQLIDGRIMVFSKKKNRWKVYRPAKHIVVPRNPRVGTLLRADKRTDRLMARIGKRTRRVTRKVTSVKG